MQQQSLLTGAGRLALAVGILVGGVATARAATDAFNGGVTGSADTANKVLLLSRNIDSGALFRRKYNTANTGNPTPAPTPEEKAKFGVFATLVKTLEFSYSQEKSTVFFAHGIDHPYYKDFIPRDFVHIRDQYPNVYEGLLDMYACAHAEEIAATKHITLTPQNMQDEVAARNAMAELAPDGNWETFSNNLLAGSKLVHARAQEASGETR